MTICTTQDHNQVQLSPADKAKTVRQPASNIINYEQQVELQLAIPGVAKDAVNLTSEGNKLRIEAYASGNGPWGNVSYQRIHPPQRSQCTGHQRQLAQRHPVIDHTQARAGNATAH